MNSQGYRVSKELLLKIAEHCDRKTLLSLLQTNKDIHTLISNYERSISAAKLENFLIPPQSHLLTSRDEKRYVIPKRNSFVTVRELELREMRMNSILDHGGFLLTPCPEFLGLTSASLDKFKAGLKRAMYMADRLADVAADPEITRAREDVKARLESLRIDATGSMSDEDIAARRDADYEVYVELAKALRTKQAAIIRDLSTIDLAFLLTLGEGAMIGWQRYMAKYATSDPNFYNKMDAFGELVFREGCFAVWAFVRGTGSMLAFVNTAVTVVAEQIWRYELGFDQSDAGLTMAVHKELKQRLQDAKEEDDDDDPCFDEVDPDNPLAVKEWAHKLVGGQIGCDEWKGYYAIEYPGSQ
ncbi:hypothetical protein VMCG_01264 [Cytospora schulzeri]|uniref:F-box domain-containing protein n=1 Tax=Cytospora schulzeri TaxID=448051 RepID=A0A423X4K7_9PEZI|nr:hypothetical protein VMCG_01264 [Valsa malicola]